MNKLFKTLSILAALTLFITACSAQAVQAQRAAPEAPDVPKDTAYETVLGKLATSNEAVDFFRSNGCTQVGEFHLCQSAGLAFGADAAQTIRTAYLAINQSDNFVPYRGKLPAGLTLNDTMADVQQKFGQPRDPHMLPGPWIPRLPDEGSTPDLVHYWAVYKKLGVTVIYNSPSADDKGATIYAILVNK